ncbi:BrnT family toxin, partial [bacterium]|nr:BrnT family toxin [bacterium]
DAKNKTNKKKHKISFEEAQTVFLDVNAKMIHDPDHSLNEDRFILLGMSLNLRILVVCHCYKEDNNIIRIISARKATKREQKEYFKDIV